MTRRAITLTLSLLLGISLLFSLSTWLTTNTIDDQVPKKPLGMGATMLDVESDNPISRYTQVIPEVSMHFPDDHQAHPGFRQEWWYLTANLTTETGERLGLQWTQFRIALAPPSSQTSAVTTPTTPLEVLSSALANPKSTEWQTKQLYFAHTAITQKELHQAHEKWSRAHPQLAGTATNPLRIKLDDWQWLSQTNGLFPATLSASTADFAYVLELNSKAPLQLQGNQGYSVKSADGQVASYYYSQPFIDVSGTITQGSKDIKVQGKAWLDREWSSQFLSRSQQGWDWFALRLNDGSALMLFQLRDSAQSKHTNDDATAFYSARRMFTDGTGRNINSTEQPGGIKMTPLTWQHTVNGDYPVSWQVTIPSEQIDVTVTALNPNSAMPLSTPYWEGPIQFTGSHTGTGYMELTGY